MFLLKRATRVLLVVTIFGILLPYLYIQPAQADGEGGPAEAGVQADAVAEVLAALHHQAKAKVEAVAEPANAKGAKCHYCVPCKSNTDLGNEMQCSPANDTCVFGVIKLLGGLVEFPVRGCATSAEADDYSCDTFLPSPELPGQPETKNASYRLCGCKWDLCNSQDATDTVLTNTPGTGSSSFSAQLILVAASLFGSLMMK